MVKIVPTPDWFLGKDVLIETFSFIILLIFSVLAIRNYKLTKNRKFLYLGSGFALIGVAQLASILTKLVLYYDFGPSQSIGNAILTSHVLSSVDIFYYAGFFFQRFLTLTGLYLIYRLPREKKFFGDYLLIIYFGLLSGLLSAEFYYFYHITAFFLLLLISENYYKIYMKNRFVNTKVLLFAFGLLGLSQLIFIASKFGVAFVIGNVIELVSYAILLILIVLILKHGKETRPYGDNIGHVGNDSRKKRKH